MGKRSWEIWDNPGVVEAVDKYWSEDPDGIERRDRLFQAGLVKQCIPFPVKKVLEVGCGAGLIYDVLVPQVISSDVYLGVDTSFRMLDLARRRYPLGTFIPGDAYNLPFRDNTFDVAVCFEVLGHLPEIQKPIEELVRVSKLAIFTVWITDGEKLTGASWVENLYEGAIQVAYPPNHIGDIIRRASKGKEWRVWVYQVNSVKFAYVIQKGTYDKSK